MNFNDIKDIKDLQQMIPTDPQDAEGKMRIIQELVPGKQITLAHVIAAPDAILYQKLGLDPSIDYAKSAIGIITMSPAETAIIGADYSRAAIGIMTVSPAETAIIMADIAMKSSGIELGFVDRFSGTLIITGLLSEVNSAVNEIVRYFRDDLGYSCCEITRR